MSLCVILVTKELKQAGGRVISEWGGALRADAGSVGAAGTGLCAQHRNRRASSVFLGRQWVCRGREPAAGSVLRVQPLAPPPLPAVLATYLAAPAGGLPNLPAHSPAGVPVPARPWFLGSSEEEPAPAPSGSLLSAVRVAASLERDCGAERGLGEIATLRVKIHALPLEPSL